jgi:hypothetical protein
VALSAGSVLVVVAAVAAGGCGGGPAAVPAPNTAGNSAASSAGATSLAGLSAGGGAGLAGAGSGGVDGGAAGGGGASGGGGMPSSLAGAAGAAAGGGTAQLVGVFVAQGHEGRITRSCDDGLTFPYNHSVDDAFRCFSDAEHDCDHSENAGRGLAFGSGAFVATWGWGHPGTLQRSTDGEGWEDVMSATPTFADVAFGNSLFVACANPTRISSDGKTWEMGGKLSFDFNYRGIEFVPAGGGTFIVTGESGENRAISYSHDGKAWLAPSMSPPECVTQLRGIAGSESAIITAGALGDICLSKDGGGTWVYQHVSERFTSPPLWTGAEFWIYAGAQLFRSADGQAWTSQDIEPKNISIGPLARSPAGTLVAANDGWQVWYEKQQLFRSTDGVHWDVLDHALFTGSHPINFVSFGYVPPSSGCGLP